MTTDGFKKTENSAASFVPIYIDETDDFPFCPPPKSSAFSRRTVTPVARRF
jgi:hypothetical protein